MPGDDDRAPGLSEPVLNTPALVGWIIGVLALVLLVQSLLPEAGQWRLINSFGVIPARYTGGMDLPDTALPGLSGLIVPLLGYSVLHGSALHLLLNAAWLLAIGTPVAQRLGGVRFLAFYGVTAILAALFYIAVKPDSVAPVIGASGAISGLFGGLARFMFERQRGGTGVAPMDRRVIAFAAVWLGLNVVMGVSGFGTEGGASAIAWEAHAGGFIAGLVLFPLFDRRPRPAV